MALKNFRPLTPTQRFKQTPGFEEITKDKPEKSLLEPRKRSGGPKQHWASDFTPYWRRPQTEISHHRFQAKAS